jgi:flagellar hook assembly protein FlgD
MVAPGLALHQNHPNPFNPATKIGFAIPEKSRVRITIYDAAGRRVRRLVDSGYPTGLHSVQWDGRDDRGRQVSSGVYFYSLDANRTRLSRKMILLK